MTRLPDFWPNRQASRFLRRADVDWHYQRFGSGRRILFIHGAGGSLHCWADVARLLGDRYDVLSIDLPGHGYSRAARSDRFGARDMASSLDAFLDEIDFVPDAIVGHSAGAVLAVILSREFHVPIFALNGAFDPFDGIAGILFPALARALHLAPFAAVGLSKSLGTEKQVRSLLRNTGSVVGDHTVRCYLELVRRPTHVGGTLGMMAQWDVAEMGAPDATASHLAVAAQLDKTVPPATTHRFAQAHQSVTLREFDDLGHLAQEEVPETLAHAITDWLAA